jgi:hypothetical protein
MAFDGQTGARKMRVNSYDDRGEVGEFQPTDGNLRVYRRSVVPNRHAPVSGEYAILNKRLAVLFRESGRLRFFLQGSGFIDLTGDRSASWKLLGKNKAQLSFDTDPPVEVAYRADYNRVLAHIAASPGTTREDLDFGLYVSNALKDEDRRERLYRDESAPPDTP